MSQQMAVLLTLVLYKLVLIGIGLWASHKVKDESDFFLGGREVGPIVSGFSYAASTSSAWVLIGFSGFVYSVGVSALWMVPGIWAGYAVMWLWVGGPLRREAAADRHVTLTDYLTAGIEGKMRRAIAVLCTILIFICFIFYIAAQFDAAAKAFMDQFNMELAESVLLGAVIIVAYSMLGGFWAVSVTDTLQGIVMALIAVLLPMTAFVAAGGWSGIAEAVAATNNPDYLDWKGGRTPMVLIGFILGVASIGLGTMGQPHLLSRLMAVKGEKERLQAFGIAMTWGVTVFIGMAILALAGRALAQGALADGEVMFYSVASQVLPPVLAGIVIAAVLSAVMSTVDSTLLAAAGAVAHDLGFNKKYPAKALLISRSVMAGIAILAVILTLVLPDSIFNRVLFAWSALGAAFGPVVAARVAGRRPSGKIIFAAIISGFAMTVLFYVYGTIPVEGTSGLNNKLAILAHIDGDPFERLVPWGIPLALCFFASHKASA